MRVTVLVRPKPGIRDPQGEAVERSLRKLGFPVDGMRVGKVIDFELETSDPDDARKQVELMCDALLANSLIESVDIDLREA
jgi:phosphoribosylformylglycinamidine synthase